METCWNDGGDFLFSDLHPEELCSYFTGNAIFAQDFSYWKTVSYASRIEKIGHLSCGGLNAVDYDFVICVYPRQEDSEVMCARHEPFPDVYDDFWFDSSVPGTATTQCPEPLMGEATWDCSSVGTWVGLPNMM